MTTPSSPPGPEDVAAAVRSGRAPSDLPGAERAGHPAGAGGAPRGGSPAPGAGGETGSAPADGEDPGDDGVGTTPSRVPPSAPGEAGYADSPDRSPRLPAAPGLDDSPVEAAGVRVRTKGAAVLGARDTALSGLVEEGVARAVAEHDPAVWGPDAVKAAASAGPGRLDLQQGARDLLARVAALRDELTAEGLDRVVLLGSGGAALAAEVVADATGAGLVVLDGPEPAQVRAALAEPGRTVVVATDPGGDVVTDHLRRAVTQVLRDGGVPRSEVGRRFVAVAAPGSPLTAVAGTEGFRALLPADGPGAGPFAALSSQALVPAALAGADCGPLLDAAAALLPELARDDGPGLALGATLGGAAVAGRDKVVLAPDTDCPAGFARWVEQLLAAATGGEGRGLLPVVVEAPDAPGTERQSDTHLVVLGGDGPLPGEPEHGTRVSGPLGALLLLWEHAAGVAAHQLRVNPFDLAGLAEVDEATATELAGPAGDPAPPALVDGPVRVHDEGGLLGGATDLRSALDALLGAVPLGGYLAVTAHLGPEADADLTRLRQALARRLAHPVTVGRGTRALTATAHHHRAGPGTGVFLQVTAEPRDDLPIPESHLTVAGLQAAQARADLRTLAPRGRAVLRVHLTDPLAGLAHLLEAAAPARDAGRDETLGGTAP